jgi:taurine dioxygenase
MSIIAAQPEKSAAIEIAPLSGALGAEIRGLDLTQDIDDATFARIEQAWHDHLVLLFRDQTLSEDDQVRFARRFGVLQSRPRPASMRAESGAVRHPEIMLVSNIRQDGKLIGSLPDGEMQFHSDMCYIEKPAKGTFLYAIEIPSQGGDTLFLNTYKAYESLPADIKARIDGAKALNVFLYGSTSREGNKPDFSVHPNYVHPVVRTHPDTRRKALFINRLMTWSIEGMDEAESAALLDRLFDHMERPDFIYGHKWRVGDLLLWDNRCTLHARTDFSDQERRLLRRVVIQGDRPY